ncbi:MAG: YbjN domain-containing protein [Clostridia bacterium]|nr:YbjN domain-containing protein [Clostridia bacterium]
MKKLIVWLLIAIVCVLPAMAEEHVEPQYAATKDFIRVMDANDFQYTCYGVDDSGDECLLVRMKNETYDRAHFYFFFNEDGDRVIVYLWNAIDFNPARRSIVLEVCNKSMVNYLYPRFYVDDTDNSLTMDYTAFLPETGKGEVCWSILEMMDNIWSACYPDFAPYAK